MYPSWRVCASHWSLIGYERETRSLFFWHFYRHLIDQEWNHTNNPAPCNLAKPTNNRHDTTRHNTTQHDHGYTRQRIHGHMSLNYSTSLSVSHHAFFPISLPFLFLFTKPPFQASHFIHFYQLPIDHVKLHRVNIRFSLLSLSAPLYRSHTDMTPFLDTLSLYPPQSIVSQPSFIALVHLCFVCLTLDSSSFPMIEAFYSLHPVPRTLPAPPVLLLHPRSHGDKTPHPWR